MIKNITFTKKVVLLNLIICLIITLLSLIGLFFGEWPIIICTLICGLISTINAFLLAKSGNMTTPNGTSLFFLLFTFLRFLLMIIGLVASALIIYFTMGEQINTYRYLIVAIAAIPYIVTPFTLAFIKQD